MFLGRRVLGLILSLAPLAAVVLLWLNWQSVYDWWQLRGYDPPKAIAALAGQTAMTDKAERIFYVNKPELISSKAKFQQQCTQTEQTIVLGCYHSGQRGIDIFNVNDPRLAGVEEVTAAHEMLHAAYERLGGGERQRIDKLLENYYRKDLKNSRIRQTINSYKKTEPNDLVNEMHSIFGTEIAKLPAELETYYQQYFTNRSKVVKLAQDYEQAFTSQENRAKAMLAQLRSLESAVRGLQAELNSESAALSRDRGSISSQAEADAFNARVRDYNAKVNRFNALVAQYNSLREQYNALVLQSQSLIKAIDTRSTQPAAN